MDSVAFKDSISGKTVRSILIFSNYSEKNYQSDFKEFMDLQMRRNLGDGFIDLHLYNIPNPKPIPYSFFREYAPKLFSKVLFYMLKQRPDFMVSDELNVQISLVRVPAFSYYFETVDEDMDPENACFRGAGVWFINNIVAPYFYFGWIESTTIVRYFAHELTHYKDLIAGVLSWDSKYSSKIKNIVGRKSAYSINYLYNSLFNLREEGLAEFMARIDSSEMELSGASFRQYNENLRRLAFMRYKKEASPFYISRIGWENMTLSGEYAVGRSMCLVVAMSVAKIKKVSYQIRIGREVENGFDFPRLQNWLSSENTLYISGLSKEVILAAISEIRSRNHYHFVNLYGRACDHLGLRDQNRAMTSRRFFDLVQAAKVYRASHIKSHLEQTGFVYSESDFKLPD